MSRASKMYDKSPKLAREDGKVTVKKEAKSESSEKKAESGSKKDEKGKTGLELYHTQAKERLKLHQKHEEEHLARFNADSGAETGEGVINKVENDSKE